MLYFKEASPYKYSSPRHLVYTQDTYDAVCLGELSKEFPDEEYSFKSNKYLFSAELEEIVNKLKELNA